MSRITAPTPTTKQHAPSHSPPDTRYSPGLKLARALGWFSIGLGIAELLRPDQIEDLTGVRRHGLIEAYGIREIICGVGILSSKRPAGWMWARVAGDALDLATLGGALVNDPQHSTRAVASIVAVAGVTALDVACAAQLSAAAAMEG